MAGVLQRISQLAFGIRTFLQKKHWFFQAGLPRARGTPAMVLSANMPHCGDNHVSGHPTTRPDGRERPERVQDITHKCVPRTRWRRSTRFSGGGGSIFQIFHFQEMIKFYENFGFPRMKTEHVQSVTEQSGCEKTAQNRFKHVSDA